MDEPHVGALLLRLRAHVEEADAVCELHRGGVRLAAHGGRGDVVCGRVVRARGGERGHGQAVWEDGHPFVEGRGPDQGELGVRNVPDRGGVVLPRVGAGDGRRGERGEFPRGELALRVHVDGPLPPAARAGAVIRERQPQNLVFPVLDQACDSLERRERADLDARRLCMERLCIARELRAVRAGGGEEAGDRGVS